MSDESTRAAHAAAAARHRAAERALLVAFAERTLDDPRSPPGAVAAAEERLIAADELDYEKLTEPELAVLEYITRKAQGRAPGFESPADVARAARQIADALDPQPPAPAAPCAACGGDPARVLPPGLPEATLEVVGRVVRGEVELEVLPA